MKCVNNKCQKEFSLDKNVVIKRKEKMWECPHCKTIHVRTGSSSNLVRDETGKLVRKYKKAKVSKAEKKRQIREKHNV